MYFVTLHRCLWACRSAIFEDFLKSLGIIWKKINTNLQQPNVFIYLPHCIGPLTSCQLNTCKPAGFWSLVWNKSDIPCKYKLLKVVGNMFCFRRTILYSCGQLASYANTNNMVGPYSSSLSLMFPQPYVPSALCSLSSIFLQPYVPSSQNRPYVPSALCSLIPK